MKHPAALHGNFSKGENVAFDARTCFRDYKSSRSITKARPAIGAIFLQCLVIIIAVTSSISDSIAPELARYLLKSFGGMLAIGLAYQFVKRRLMPDEVKLYFAFLIWAVASAMVSSEDMSLTLKIAFIVFQMGILLWATTVSHQMRPDLRLVMMGIWGIGVLYSFVAYYGQAISNISTEAGGRMEVMNANPNNVGQIFLFAMFAAFYLWERITRLFFRLMMIGSVPVFVGFLLYTGSRKMLVGTLIFFVVWTLTIFRGDTAKGEGRAAKVVLLLAIVGVAVLAFKMWQYSPMSDRYDRMSDKKDTSIETRRILYARGWALFLENPIAGVGLMNQKLKMSHEAHSDFIDVLCSTGIIGAVLYFSIYVVAFRRIRKLNVSTNDVSKIDRRYFIIYLVIIVWLMFGFSRYMDLLHLVVFGSFIGVLAQPRDRVHVLMPAYGGGKAGAVPPNSWTGS